MMESKFSQTVKFDEFERNPNLINVNINLVGIIAKIGELKYANQARNKDEDKAELLSIRDLQIYDDTFTMVRLLLRNHFAENCEHFKVDDIISLKNVKIMKVQNRFVMTTLQETVMEINTALYESLWLKQWFLHNRKDIVSNNFMQFNNLSMTPAKPKKEREDITPSTQVECSPAKVPRLSSNTVNTLEKIDESSLADSSQSSPSSPVDLKSEFVKDNDLSLPRSQENTQNEIVQVISDDEKDIKTNNQEEEKETNEEVTKQKEKTVKVKKDEPILDKVEKEPNESDNVKKDVRYETYNALMHSFLLKNDWDEEKDQYLVNFITKNSYNLQNDSIYLKFITEMPNIFFNTTPSILKERVYMLSSVKNFLYLMKLCGGDHLTTEKEKSIFLIKIEKLRESMKSIKD